MKYEGNLQIENATAAVKYAGVTEVTGDLYIHDDAKLEALTSAVGDLYINADAKLEAPKLYKKGFGNFRVYDNIAGVVLSTRAKSSLEILSCRQATIQQGKLVGKKFFIAKKGNATAQATTIKAALEELAFKRGERGTLSRTGIFHWRRVGHRRSGRSPTAR